MSYRKTVVSARRDQKKGRTGGLTEEQKQEIREAFDLFDTDGSGTIDAKASGDALLGGWPVEGLARSVAGRGFTLTGGARRARRGPQRGRPAPRRAPGRGH
jgi:hypothetical protein